MVRDSKHFVPHLEGNSSLHMVHDTESAVIITKVYPLIPNFRLVLNIVYFLLGDPPPPPPSEFYVPKFQKALSVTSSYVLYILYFR